MVNEKFYYGLTDRETGVWLTCGSRLSASKKIEKGAARRAGFELAISGWYACADVLATKSLFAS